MFGKPSTQYLNAMTIATNEAIADTGATSIFVMEGADVKNKRPALKPLTINLPDGRQIKLTHICDIDIPGQPTTLTGHIVPLLAIASLFGIRVLCKAGCKVVFDDDKCDVMYQGKLILRGYKDPSTDLWTLPIVPTPAKVWTTPGTTAQGPHVKMQAASVLYSRRMNTYTKRQPKTGSYDPDPTVTLPVGPGGAYSYAYPNPLGDAYSYAYPNPLGDA
jgi:hypothetical protein